MKSGTFKSDISGTFVSDTSGTFGVIYSIGFFERPEYIGLLRGIGIDICIKWILLGRLIQAEGMFKFFENGFCPVIVVRIVYFGIRITP